MAKGARMGKMVELGGGDVSVGAIDLELCITLQHTATHCNTLQHTGGCIRRGYRLAPSTLSEKGFSFTESFRVALFMLHIPYGPMIGASTHLMFLSFVDCATSGVIDTRRGCNWNKAFLLECNRHTLSCGLILGTWHLSPGWMSHVPKTWMSHVTCVWTSLVAYMNTSCHIYECVILHEYGFVITHIYMSHVTCMLLYKASRTFHTHISYTHFIHTFHTHISYTHFIHTFGMRHFKDTDESRHIMICTSDA